MASPVLTVPRSRWSRADRRTTFFSPCLPAPAAFGLPARCASAASIKLSRTTILRPQPRWSRQSTMCGDGPIATTASSRIGPYRRRSHGRRQSPGKGSNRLSGRPGGTACSVSWPSHALAGEITIQGPGNELAAPDSHQRARTDAPFATPVISGVHDRPGGNLRLVNRRHRLGMSGQAGPAPIELRRIHRRQLHHRDMDVLAVVDQLGADRVGKATNGELRAAVSGPEVESTDSSARAYLYDRSLVARVHPFQSGQGAIYSPQIGHLRGTLVLFGFDIDKPCENGGHRVIDPDVDRAQFPFGPLGGSLDLPWIRKIYRNREPFRPPLLDLSAGIPKPIGITSQQRDGAPGLANSRSDSAPPRLLPPSQR